MKLLKPSVEICFTSSVFLKIIEKAARTCYKSEDKITSDSHKNMIKRLINKGHLSPIEHSILTVKFITDRGVSHELVRHRVASYSQESTRYCNYSKLGIQYVIPYWYENIYENVDSINNDILNSISIDEIGVKYNLTKKELDFLIYLDYCEKEYNKHINIYKEPPQKARLVLPHCIKTEIIVSTNFREWRYILDLRTRKDVHPQMIQLMYLLCFKLKEEYPEIFELILKPVHFSDIRLESHFFNILCICIEIIVSLYLEHIGGVFVEVSEEIKNYRTGKKD